MGQESGISDQSRDEGTDRGLPGPFEGGRPIATSAEPCQVSPRPLTVTPAVVALSGAAQVSLRSDSGGAVVRVETQGRQALEFSIEMTDQGPIVKVRTHAVELRADIVAVDCREFSVHAHERLRLVSDGDMVSTVAGKSETTAAHIAMEATHGSVVARANDDVQLLGEQLLLNCERQASLPAWLPAVQEEAPRINPLPLSAVSGDASLLRDLDHPHETPE